MNSPWTTGDSAQNELKAAQCDVSERMLKILYDAKLTSFQDVETLAGLLSTYVFAIVAQSPKGDINAVDRGIDIAKRIIDAQVNRMKSDWKKQNYTPDVVLAEAE